MKFIYFYFILLYLKSFHNTKKLQIDFQNQFLNLTFPELINFNVNNSIYEFIFQDKNPKENEICNSQIIKYYPLKNEFISKKCNLFLSKYDIIKFKQYNNKYYFLYKTFDNLTGLFYENNEYFIYYNSPEFDFNYTYLTILDSKAVILLTSKEKKKLHFFFVNDKILFPETKTLEYIDIKCINFKNYILCINTNKNSDNYFTKIYFNESILQCHMKKLPIEYQIFDLYNNNNEDFILCFSNDSITIKCYTFTDFDNYKNDELPISNNINFEETIKSFKIIKDNISTKIIANTNNSYIIQNFNKSLNSITINKTEKKFLRYQSNNTIERIELINQQLYILTKISSDKTILVNKFSDYSIQTIKLNLNDFNDSGIPFKLLNSFFFSSDEIKFENDKIIKIENSFYFTEKKIGKFQFYYYTNEKNYYYIFELEVSCKEKTYYYKDNNTCLNEAPEGYFIDTIQDKILKCSGNCKYCSMIGVGMNKCLICKDDYKLYNYNCIKECPINSFIYKDNCYDECPINTSIIDDNNCLDNIRNDYTETILNFTNSNQTIQEYIINDTYKNICYIFQNDKKNLTSLSNFIILYNLYIESYNWEKNYTSDLEIILKNYTSYIKSISDYRNYSNLDYLNIIESYVNFFRNIKQLTNESQNFLISNLSKKTESLLKLKINKTEITLFLNLLNQYIQNLKNLNSLNFESKNVNNNLSYFLNISSIVNKYSKGVMKSVNDYRKLFINYLNLNKSLIYNSFNSSQISFATFFNNNSESLFHNSNLNISISHINFDELSIGKKLKTLKSLNCKMALMIPLNYLNISYISITKFMSFPYLNKKLIKYILNQFFSINFYNKEIKEITINSSFQNISIAFKRENSNFKYCIFYNNTSNKFSSNGCISQLIGDYIICSCNHLTDFSISSFNLNTEFDSIKEDINNNNYWKSRIISSPLNLKSFTLNNSSMIYIFIFILLLYFGFLNYTICWDLSYFNEKKGDLFIRYIEDNNIENQIHKIKIFVDEEIKYYLNSDNSQNKNKSLINNLSGEEYESDDSNNEDLKKEDINKDKYKKNEILIEMKEILSINNNNNEESNKMKIKNLSSLNETKNKYIKDNKDISVKRLSINFLLLGYRLSSFKIKHKNTFDSHIKNKIDELSKIDNKEEILLNSSKNEKWLSFVILFFITLEFEYRFCVLFSDYPIIISKTSLLTLIFFRLFLQIGIITIFSIRYEMNESINLLKEIQIVIISVILSDIIYSVFKFILMKKKIPINMDKTEQLVIKYKSVCYTTLSFFIIFGISCFIVVNNLWISIYEIENNIKIYYLFEFILNIIFDYFIYEVFFISLKAFFLNLLLSKYNKQGIFYRFIICIAKTIHNILIFYIVE